jgi:hypothetical protein
MSNANALKERINLLLSSVFPSVREHVLFPHTVTSLAFLIDDAYGTNNIFKLSNVHVITAMGSKSDQPTDLDDAQASAALHRLLQSGIQEPQQQPNNDNGEHHMRSLLCTHRARSLGRSRTPVGQAGSLDGLHGQVQATVQRICEPVGEAIRRKEIPVPAHPDQA